MNKHCDNTQATIQDRIDGQLVDAADLRAMEQHLASCERCRRFRTDMTELHDELAALPELEFPADALEEVWDRTIRRRPRSVSGHWRWVAAAAAVLMVALAGSWFGLFDREREYSPAEVAQATLEARAALGLAGQALRHSQDVAMEEVLGGQVTPALEKITIGLPETYGSERRRTGI